MNRVLIVDDKPENLYMLRALLQGHGYVVEEARNGAEALNQARQAPPSLIIADLLMPVMDGYSLLKQWKADERLKIIPFVVFTATYTDPKDERLALGLGADAFIIKPTEPEPFMARILEVLAKNDRGELPASTETEVEENVLLKEYSEVLVRKLEAKALQLEQANRVLLQDIAERKRMEAELRLRDRAMQAVSQGIVITDPNQPDNPVVYASAGFQRITGYAPEEVVGRNCRFLQGKDTSQETVGKLRVAVASGTPCQVELLNYRKDGAPFWNALSVNPVHDENGALSFFVGVQADITDRKNLEEQFRQAQKMEAVGRLAGGVAHDFNNLLTVITSYSELLLSGAIPPDEQRNVLREIRRAGDRAASLTRQLLAFSRKQFLQPVELDLNRLISETENMLRRLIGEDIDVAASLDPALAWVEADPGQIEQVMMNLIINARDAMPTGGLLTIETKNVELDHNYAQKHPEVQPGHYVMLAVTDTGCGMDDATKAKLFEPFFTTKELGKGTGLGLAMVHGIVKQSGGSIEVYSEVGRGTTFKVYLPRIEAPVSAANASPSQSLMPRGTETILLVEDEPTVRAVVRIVLESSGYTVLETQSGEEAMHICRQYQAPIHLLMTDVVMPKMSGRQLAESVVALHPAIRVLYISGYTDDAVVRHGVLEAGMHFLQKPFTSTVLARKVRDVLDAGHP